MCGADRAGCWRNEEEEELYLIGYALQEVPPPAVKEDDHVMDAWT